MSIPRHLFYTSDHEWIDLTDEPATVGITAYAADALGDVVFVQLPVPGTTIEVGEICGEVESTKSVSDLYAPVDGEVVEINTILTDDPGVLNTDAFGDGWLFRINVENASRLLSAAEYDDLIKEI